jgi:hypothetical protein
MLVNAMVGEHGHSEIGLDIYRLNRENFLSMCRRLVWIYCSTCLATAATLIISPKTSLDESAVVGS